MISQSENQNSNIINQETRNQETAAGGPVYGNRKSRVEQAVQELIHAIWESPEYIHYQDVRARVHEFPELEQQIHAFRKKNYETQNFAQEWELYERMEELEREGAQFRKDPLVDEYLTAELAICRQFQNINGMLIRNIDFDLGFTFDN